MAKLKDLRGVDATYARTGPNQTTMRQALPCAASTAFEALKDGATWKHFLGIDVTWTSPEPFGIGTTRTITTNGQTIEEVFNVWEDGLIMGFYFSRATLPVAAFAEIWELIPTGDNSCDLQWHYAWEWGGPLTAVLSPVFGAGFAFNGRRSLPKLAKLLT